MYKSMTLCEKAQINVKGGHNCAEQLRELWEDWALKEASTLSGARTRFRIWDRNSSERYQPLCYCALQLKECTEAVGCDTCVQVVVSKDTGAEKIA
jgi:hypothetical protein